MTRVTYRQCKETGKLLLLEVWHKKYGTPKRADYNIEVGMEPFKSNIDGSIISDSKQLREHNKRHGVTNAADYSPDFLKNRERQRIDAGQKYLKETRIADIKEAIHRHS